VRNCLVRLYLEEGERGPAVALWREVVEQGLPSQLARQYRLEVGLGLAEQKAWSEAGLTFQSLYARGLSDRLAVRAAVENAAVALDAGRPDAAERILRAVDASPLRDASVEARSVALRARMTAP
jgi:hypothetical protein